MRRKVREGLVERSNTGGNCGGVGECAWGQGAAGDPGKLDPNGKREMREGAGPAAEGGLFLRQMEASGGF